MSFIMSSILSQNSLYVHNWAVWIYVRQVFFFCFHMGIGVHVCINLVFPSDTVSPDPLRGCMRSEAALLCPAAVACHSFREDNKPEPVTFILTSNLQGSTWCSGLSSTLGRLQFSRHRVPKNGCPWHSNKIRRGKGKGAGTNVHFEKTHNEHTVASLAALSSTQQLNASLYLAFRLCRLSIAPLRQSSVTLNNGTLTILGAVYYFAITLVTHLSTVTLV